MTGNPEAIPGQKSSCGSFTRLSNDKRACGYEHRVTSPVVGNQDVGSSFPSSSVRRAKSIVAFLSPVFAKSDLTLLSCRLFC
jgi:hypothetical protein